jgi:dTDP-4-dehydrorhamnose 3,5-epimerase
MNYRPKIRGVEVTKLEHIPTAGGCVMHGLNRDEISFSGFGEVYFSCVEEGKIRGWKKHREMTLNLIVVLGNIRFVLIEGREMTDSLVIDEITLSPDKNYSRLTVPPGVWVGFQGVDCQKNILANIANIKHDPTEADQVALDDFDFNW